MRLLLDECIGDWSLRDALVAAGHDVVRSVDELGGGVDDSAVFTLAGELQPIVVGEEHPDRPGMLLIYQDNKPTDMNSSDILMVLANVETTYPDGFAGQMVVLNGYRW